MLNEKKKRKISIDITTEEGKNVDDFFSKLGYSLSDFVLLLTASYLKSADLYDSDKIKNLSKEDIASLVHSIKISQNQNISADNTELEQIKRDIEILKKQIGEIKSGTIQPDNAIEIKSQDLKKTEKTSENSENSGNKKKISGKEIKNLKNILDNW